MAFPIQDRPIKMTLEEYLALSADESELRYEFIDGEVYAMSGGTKRHNQIPNNLAVALDPLLDKQGCIALNSSQQVQVSPTKYVYPDLTVVCGEPRFLQDEELTLTNPSMVVEVISESSQGYDLGVKAQWYRGMPSLQLYLVLQQNRPAGQLQVRQQDGWFIHDFSGIDTLLTVDFLGGELAVSAIYKNITFP